jgi:hypothetical protein
MIMSRLAILVVTALSLAASAAHANPLKDAARHGHVVTTHGVWDSR